MVVIRKPIATVVGPSWSSRRRSSDLAAMTRAVLKVPNPGRQPGANQTPVDRGRQPGLDPAPVDPGFAPGVRVSPIAMSVVASPPAGAGKIHANAGSAAAMARKIGRAH